jgi:hypothetical protein
MKRGLEKGSLMSRTPSDLTLAPNLSEEGGTGPLRTRRPVYVDLLPPCNHACPAGENIQAWLAGWPRRRLGATRRPSAS